MEPHVGDNEEAARIRRVTFTGEHVQLVGMGLRPGEEVGRESHGGVDPFFGIEEAAADFVQHGRVGAHADAGVPERTRDQRAAGPLGSPVRTPP